MSDYWSEKECWSDYSAVNLSDADKNDFSDKDYNVKQSINLSNYFVLDHLYMFFLAQLEVKSDFENVHQDTEFFDYIL